VDGSTQAYNKNATRYRRDELIVGHLPMVRHVIGKLTGQLPAGVDVENLESAGTLGLVEAATNFDQERGSQFKTYAYIRIRGAVLDELRRNCPLPQHVLEKLVRIRKAYHDLPPPVSMEALSTATGFSQDELADCLEAMRITRVISWERSSNVILARSDERQEPPAGRMERAERQKLLAAAIAALPERERLVVTLYHMEDMRLKEIATVLKLSESRVSRLLQAALFQIGEYMRIREA
jgi:RNA polymerase sigma factor for flagellar operon FliA